MGRVGKISMIALGLCCVAVPWAAEAASPLMNLDCTYKGGAREGQNLLVVVQNAKQVALVDMNGLATGDSTQISSLDHWKTITAAPMNRPSLPSTQDLVFTDGSILQTDYKNTVDTPSDTEMLRYLNSWHTDATFGGYDLKTVENVQYKDDFITFGFVSLLTYGAQKLLPWQSTELTEFTKNMLTPPDIAANQLEWLSVHENSLQIAYKSWRIKTQNQFAPTVIFGPRLKYEIDLLTGEFEFDYDGTRAVGSCVPYVRKIPPPPSK